MTIFQMTRNFCLGVATAGLLATPLLAQDGVSGTEESLDVFQTENTGAIVIASSEDFGDGSGEKSMRIMASGDGESGIGRLFMSDAFAGSGIMGGGDSFSMLSNESVQKDLELVGDQLDKVNELRSDFGKRIQQQIQQMTSGGNVDGKALMEELKALQADQKKQIEGMLLPHQLDRLKQVKLQMQMQKQGTSRTLGSKEVAEALGIDDEQQKRIRKRAKELQKELEERMVALKEEIRGKLMDELTSDQQAKLAELQGDKFEYKETDLGAQIRQRIEKRRMQSQENN